MTRLANMAQPVSALGEPGKARRTDEHPDTQLIRQYRRGDDDAARKLYEKYRKRVDGYIQKSMGQKVRNHEEPSDLAQWVFADLFRTMRDADATLDLDGRLWTMLGTIAHGVICQRSRYWAAQCRDADREQHCKEIDAVAKADDTNPELVATMKDLMQTLVGTFDEPERSIVVLLLKGHRPASVCRLLNVNDHAVRKIRRAAERIMERYFEESDL